MGYCFILGPCFACKRVFSFHPHKVPSYRVDGERQPVCNDCMTLVNAKRKATGFEPLLISEGAYEPCHESEL